MKNTINLLSFNTAPMTFWDKLYMWALSIGRYIIIITELIVLLCFLYKFKLDNDMSALQQSFQANLRTAKQNYQEEKAIVSYQNKVRAEGMLMNNQVQFTQTLSHTLSLIPSDITVTAIKLSNNETVTVNGSVKGAGNAQLTEIQALANTFKADSMYNSTALSNVTTDASVGTTQFTLNANITSQKSGS